VPVNIGSDHIWGSVNAPLNIVEYGDYECPYTGMAYPIMKQIASHNWIPSLRMLSKSSAS
jgi:protein-disulfide isomerase